MTLSPATMDTSAKPKRLRNEPPAEQSSVRYLAAVPTLLELIAVVAGASILWNGAEGRGVVRANTVSIAVFILVLGTVLVLHSLVLRVRRTEVPQGVRLRTADRWLTAVRNILFVVIAVFSTHFESYFIQWIICFAALLLTALGAAATVLSGIRREDGPTISLGLGKLIAGLLGLTFTMQVHGWDPAFIAPLTGLILVPAFIAWSVRTAVKA